MPTEFVKLLGNYEINKLGQVRNCKTGRLLKPDTNHAGYLHIRLQVEGKQRTFRLHRLVAEKFVPNPDLLDEVDHIDEDRANPRWDNLSWVTRQQNVAKSQALTFTVKSPSGEMVTITNLSEFARENGLSQGRLSDLKNGKTKSHKGWTLWRLR